MISRTRPIEATLTLIESTMMSIGGILAQLQTRVKAMGNAAARGKIQDIRTGSEEFVELIGRLRTLSSELHELTAYDIAAYMQTGEYASELLTELSRVQQGSAARVIGDEIIVYPIVIQIDAEGGRLLIDRKATRELRPKWVVQLIQAAAQRYRGRSSHGLLEAIEHIYLLKTNNTVGIALPLIEIYDLLTALPGSSKNYTRRDFSYDILAIVAGAGRVTKDGLSVSLPASTSTTGGRVFARVISEAGEEKMLSSIRFDRC